MNEKVYDWREVADLLTEIAAAMPPGYRYQKHGSSCTYFWADEPDCIIGHLLARVGFTAQDDPGICNIDDACNRGTFCYSEKISSRFTFDAVRFMQQVQTLQDADVLWVDAVGVTYGKWTLRMIDG